MNWLAFVWLWLSESGKLTRINTGYFSAYWACQMWAHSNLRTQALTKKTLFEYITPIWKFRLTAHVNGGINGPMTRWAKVDTEDKWRWIDTDPVGKGEGKRGWEDKLSSTLKYTEEELLFSTLRDGWSPDTLYPALWFVFAVFWWSVWEWWSGGMGDRTLWYWVCRSRIWAVFQSSTMLWMFEGLLGYFQTCRVR